MTAYELGSLAISDKDLQRIETVAREARATANDVVNKAAAAAATLKGGLLANALITAVSTGVLVAAAYRARHQGGHR